MVVVLDDVVVDFFLVDVVVFVDVVIVVAVVVDVMFLLLLLSLFLLLEIIVDVVVNFFVYHSLWIVPSYTGDMIDSFGRLLYRYQTSFLHALKEF